MLYWVNCIPRPQSPLGAWARGPGGSGDTRDTAFEVLDFRTSGHFRSKWKLEDFLLKALNHLNLQSMTLGQEQVTAIRNVVKNQKWPEVLKSWTSNPVSPKPPGTLTQASRRFWGRERVNCNICAHFLVLMPRIETNCNWKKWTNILKLTYCVVKQSTRIDPTVCSLWSEPFDNNFFGALHMKRGDWGQLEKKLFFISYESRIQYSETSIKRTPNQADTKPGPETNVWYFPL